MVLAQGGDVACVREDLENYSKATFVREVTSDADGIIASIDALEVGKTCVDIGAGRRVAADDVIMNCGVIFQKKCGYVS